MTIDDRPFQRINLNGLYALDAILHARSLTEAGRKVALSQPAMSMSLRRMREHFHDELVSYDGGVKRLTALAVELRPRIRRLLREADDTFRPTLDFDPATATGTISIATLESIEIMFLTHVVPVLLRQAPGIDLRLVPFDYDSAERMFDRGLDLLIAPRPLNPHGIISQPLFKHELIGMAWSEHPLPGDPLTDDAYLAARHAALFQRIEQNEFGGLPDDPILSARRVVVRTGLHSALPRLVIGTDLIATTTIWLAQYYATMLPLKLVGLPIRPFMPPMAAQWLPHRNGDPVIRWLVDTLVDTADRFGPAGNRWHQHG